MRSILLTVCFLFLLSRPAYSQVFLDHYDGPLLRAGLATFAVAEGTELYFTIRAIERGKGREGNIFFAPFADKPARAILVKAAATGASSYFIYKIHQGHPRLGTVLSWTVAGVFTGIAVHNARIAR